MLTLFLHVIACAYSIGIICYRIYVTGVKDSCQPRAIYSLGGVCMAAMLCLVLTSGFLQNLLVILVLPLASWFYMEEMLRPRLLSSNNKVIFITGCDSGFGRALTRRLDAAGVTVFAGCYLSDTSDLAAECSSRLRTVRIDVTSDDDVNHAAQFVKDNLRPGEQLWGIVNNAGVVYGGEMEFITMDAIHKMYDVNCLGQLRVTRAFLPLLRQAKGRIVNMTSVVGRVSVSNLGGYCMSKFATEACSAALGQEMTKWGVNVSVIAPGPFATPLGSLGMENYWDNMWADMSPEVRAAYGKHYIDAYRTVPEFATAPDLSPVTSAMEDALLSPRPLRRYTMGDGSWLLPAMGWLFPAAFCNPRLQKLFTIYTGATPSALQETTGS